MAKLKRVFCTNCKKPIYRSVGRINENLKLGYNFYCSRECQYQYRTKKQVLVCENCGKPFKRTPHEISLHNYCSQSCATIVNNRKDLKRRPRFKICLKCGKQFRGSNLKYCSLKCRGGTEPKHTHQELIEAIKREAQKLQRVPARREIKESSACKRFFGSWNNAIIAAGLQPNRSHSQRMYKRTNTVALDGHLCDSVSEALIDNWLTENNIFHEKDVFYPETNYKADWAIFIGDRKIFVEYFGLANDSPRYDRAIKRKQKLCLEHDFKLIEIYPQDIYPKKNLYRKLQDKFRRLISISNFGDSGLEPLYSRTRSERLTN